MQALGQEITFNGWFMLAANREFSKAFIEQCITDFILERKDCLTADQISTLTFGQMGITSEETLELVFMFSEVLGSELDETLPFEYPILSELSQHVFDLIC